jgi:uncharacterized membrane protein YvlD (DUF360 family)
MSWTPPSKFIVTLTFLIMAFGIFIFMDQLPTFGLWPSILPTFQISGYNGWIIIALVLYFLTWFLFFLGVKLKGL